MGSGDFAWFLRAHPSPPFKGESWTRWNAILKLAWKGSRATQGYLSSHPTTPLYTLTLPWEVTEENELFIKYDHRDQEEPQHLCRTPQPLLGIFSCLFMGTAENCLRVSSPFRLFSPSNVSFVQIGGLVSSFLPIYLKKKKNDWHFVSSSIDNTRNRHALLVRLSRLYFPLWHLPKVISGLKLVCMIVFSLRGCWCLSLDYFCTVICSKYSYFNDPTYRKMLYFTKISVSICLKTLLMALERCVTASEICENTIKYPGWS